MTSPPPPNTEASALPASEGRPPRTWRVTIGALVGLLIGVTLAMAVAIAVTVIIGGVTERALRNDVELEDEADDLLAAVLEVRHHHRNLFFTGPTRAAIDDLDRAVADVGEELDELAVLDIVSPEIPQADELREMFADYQAGYLPAIPLYASDRAAFDDASDHGLERLAEIQAQVVRLEEHGEELAESAFQSIEETTLIGTVILVLLLIGLGAVGVALSYAVVRVLREQRDLDDAQRETAASLARALETRSNFIADASHELRTPLTVLRGNAELGLETGATDCGHEVVLREIVAESVRMTRLVEDLLFLARYDAGSVPLDPQLLELEPWLAEVAARAEILAHQRGSAIELDLDALGGATLDPERISQAILVLIDNAAKFSPAGEPVRLSAVTADGVLRVEVADRGPGIPEAVRPFIFERFYRVDRARGRRNGGAGLGLSIAQAIVAAHGGNIEALARPGGGTLMRIRMPRTPIESDLPPGRLATTTPSTTS